MSRTNIRLKRHLTAAPLELGFFSAWSVEGLNGVVFRNRNGWHFSNPYNGAFGGVATRAKAIQSLEQVQGSDL